MALLLPERPRAEARAWQRRRRPLSVCLYTCSANVSGMGTHMLALAEEYVRRGIDLRVVYWPAPATEAILAPAAADLGVRLLPTSHPRADGYADGVIGHLTADLPDVFHVHVGTGLENFGGARAARAAGVPAVVETLHLPWLLTSKRKPPRFLRTLGGIDRLITVSDAQRATYESIGVPSERMVTIPNGVKPRGAGIGRAEARRRLGLDPEQPAVLTVGRLFVQKGHRYLIEALPRLLPRLPGLTAVIVGDGPLRDDLQRQAERLGVAHAVRLPGHRSDAPDLLDAADVFVLPSLCEGMPMALQEAMDAGVPVVATRAVGTDEVVVDGETGRLVRTRDPAALADALAEVLADPLLGRAWGLAGRRRYRKRFTSEQMASETLAVYADVLAGARRSATSQVRVAG